MNTPQITNRAELKAEIKKGLESLDRGDVFTFTSKEQFMKHIRAEGRKRLALHKKLNKDAPKK